MNTSGEHKTESFTATRQRDVSSGFRFGVLKSGATVGEVIYVRARAVNAVGNGEWSDQVKVTPVNANFTFDAEGYYDFDWPYAEDDHLRGARIVVVGGNTVSTFSTSRVTHERTGQTYEATYSRHASFFIAGTELHSGDTFSVRVGAGSTSATEGLVTVDALR